MNKYRVTIPYTDAAVKGASVFYALVEVTAENLEDARKLGMEEFGNLTRLGGKSNTRTVLTDQVAAWLVRANYQAQLNLVSNPFNAKTAVCKLQGTIDNSTMRLLEEELARLRDGSFKCVVLDLAGLEYVNSSGLGLFFNAEGDMKIVLVKVPKKIQEILHMLGLDQFISISDDYETASKI